MAGLPAAESLLNDDIDTFWESDEGNVHKGAKEPWVAFKFSQLDQLRRVALKFDPGDESCDALPATVELLVGPGRTLETVATIVGPPDARPHPAPVH